VANALFKLFVRFISFVTIVTIALSTILAFTASPLSAASEAARWTALKMPETGEAGGWVLAPGYDIRYLTGAADGTLFACAANETCQLIKSTDGGLKWTSLSEVQNTIIALAVSPHDANVVYYATAASVYRSADGGKHFFLLPGVPGAGAGNVEITSLAVGWADGAVIAAGTRDTDSDEYGGLYLCYESAVVPTWEDTGIGSYDVYGAAFPPDFAEYRQIIAAATDKTDSFIFSYVSGMAWNAFNEPARFNKDNSGNAVAITRPAAIAFPAVTTALCRNVPFMWVSPPVPGKETFLKLPSMTIPFPQPPRTLMPVALAEYTMRISRAWPSMMKAAVLFFWPAAPMARPVPAPMAEQPG
jgi:hypothetical protein